MTDVFFFCNWDTSNLQVLSPPILFQEINFFLIFDDTKFSISNLLILIEVLLSIFLFQNISRNFFDSQFSSLYTFGIQSLDLILFQ